MAKIAISPLALVALLFATSFASAQDVSFVQATEKNTVSVGGTTPFAEAKNRALTSSGAQWWLCSDWGWDKEHMGVYEKTSPSARLKTTVGGLEAGKEYGVYVYFISPNSGGDNWPILAGFSPQTNEMGVYYRTDAGTKEFGLCVTTSGSVKNQTRYRAFVGNCVADKNGGIAVFIDNTSAKSSFARTWYCGVGIGPMFMPPPDVGATAQTKNADGSFRLATDGAWTWYNDPRALFHNGSLYVGYVRMADGRSCVNACDIKARTYTTVIETEFRQRDDHNNFGLLPLIDGRLMAFAAKHDYGPKHSEYYISKNKKPVTAADWGPMQKLSYEKLTNVSYQNPFQFSSENGRIYNFSRSINWNPTLYTSDDCGATWNPAIHLIKAGQKFGGKRPYVKYSSNYKDRADMLYTDGHPDSVDNSLYHLYIKGGNIYNTDGKLLKTLADAPLDHDSQDGKGNERGSVIYEFSKAPSSDYNDHIENGRAWCWEVVNDKRNDDAPVCVFIVQTRGDIKDRATAYTADRIYYYYARYIPGKGWQKRFIAQGGRPLYPTQRYYAGGIAIDPENPNVVYISTNAAKPFDLSKIGTEGVPLGKNERYEIYRGVIDEKMNVKWTPVTKNSIADNLRPYVPRNSPYKESLVYFHGTYTAFTNYATEVRGIFKK